MRKVILLCAALLFLSSSVAYAKHHKSYDKYGSYYDDDHDDDKYDHDKKDDYDDDKDDHDDDKKDDYDDRDDHDEKETSQTCNLVYNPGFEHGTDGWGTSRSGTRLSIRVNSGSYAIRLRNSGIGQTVTEFSDIDTRKTYYLEGYYKHKGTIYSTWIGVTYYDRYWRVIDEDTLSLRKSSKYKKFSLKTRPPRGTKHVYVWAWSYTSRWAKTYLDDFSFQTESCSIAAVNSNPVIEAIADQQTIQNTAVSLFVNASDADGDMLTYSAEGLPGGLMINAQTAEISGMPTEMGEFRVSVTVRDGNGGEATQSFNWSITAVPNSTPVLQAIADQQSVQGEFVRFLLEAVDADGDTLSYSAEGLPNGVTVNRQTAEISGTPSEAGEYRVSVQVSDGNGGVDSQTFSWSITPRINEACNYLQNRGFEGDATGWTVYGENSFVSDAYEGSSAIKIRNGGVEQTSIYLDNGSDTYQFNGYYKTVGTTGGISVGMVFLDSNNSYISSKTLFLADTDTYTKFIVNATVSDEVKYIQGWLWASADANNTGEILLDDLALSSSACYSYALPSALPPKGLKPNEVPQFVVLGFDDNTEAEGINWVIDLFADKYNRDGSEARVSFYMNSARFHDTADYNATELLDAVKRLSTTTHEIGNHTDNHMVHLMSAAMADKNDGLNMGVQVGADVSEETYFDRIKRLSKSAWEERILAATNDLVTLAEINADVIKGFRAPYLLYTGATMSILKEQNFVYDCSIEEGYASEFDGTNFRWPYQLNEGSPGHTESWYGRGDNSERVDIKTIEGLWELPNYALMVPKDSECAQYGIEPGLWNRLVANIPYLTDYKITGLDYNLWSMGGVNKAEMLGILKYNLDLRLKGNRAPFMFGTHSQYYTKAWADDFVPNATVEEMRAAISEFVEYALSKEAVRIRPSIEIIKWCEDPQPIP